MLFDSFSIFHFFLIKGINSFGESLFKMVFKSSLTWKYPWIRNISLLGNNASAGITLATRGQCCSTVVSTVQENHGKEGDLGVYCPIANIEISSFTGHLWINRNDKLIHTNRTHVWSQECHDFYLIRYYCGILVFKIWRHGSVVNFFSNLLIAIIFTYSMKSMKKDIYYK